MLRSIDRSRRLGQMMAIFDKGGLSTEERKRVVDTVVDQCLFELLNEVGPVFEVYSKLRRGHHG